MKDFNEMSIAYRNATIEDIEKMRFKVDCIIEKSDFVELLGFPKSNVESKESFNNELDSYLKKIDNIVQNLENLQVLLEDCFF